MFQPGSSGSTQSCPTRGEKMKSRSKICKIYQELGSKQGFKRSRDFVRKHSRKVMIIVGNTLLVRFALCDIQSMHLVTDQA